MGTLAILLPLAAEANAAEEGKKIIISMLVVGLIFASVVVLGDVSKALRHRRKRRTRPRDVNTWTTVRR